MELPPPSGPRVDPIGIVRYPEGFEATPRVYGRRLKTTAVVMLVIFSLVVVVTTGVSLGRYCLTSDGADVSGLVPWLFGPSARWGSWS